MNTLRSGKLLALLAACLLLGGICRGEGVTFTLNTAPLTTLPGSAGAPFALAFSLTDGGQLGNNTVTLSNFSFGVGGSASGSAIPGDCVTLFFTCGGESGVISASNPGSSAVTLSDTGFFNGLVEGFSPGSMLTFNLTFTGGPDTCVGCSPDAFVLQILTPCASNADVCGNLPTTDVVSSSFLAINLATGQVSSFSSDPKNTTFAGITASTTPLVATPEPATLFLLTAGLAAIALLFRRPPAPS